MRTNNLIKLLLLIVIMSGTLAVIFFEWTEVSHAQSGCPVGSWTTNNPLYFHYSWEKSYFNNVLVKEYYIADGFNSSQISQIETGFAKWDAVGRRTCMKIGFERTMDSELADITVTSPAPKCGIQNPAAESGAGHGMSFCKQNNEH
jgi:hypothetical protein